MSIPLRRVGRFVAAALAVWLATAPVLSAAERREPLGGGAGRVQGVRGDELA